ncbi:unnamed protein product [Calypogeia fissa]
MGIHKVKLFLNCAYFFRAYDDQAGINALLEAEQNAQVTINNARSTKLTRLRQVKEEAAREASRYRAQRETEFRRKLTEATGDAGALAKQIEGQSFIKLQALRTAANRAANEVIDMVVGYVINCKNDFGEPDTTEQEINVNLGPSIGAMAPSFVWPSAQLVSNPMRPLMRTPIFSSEEPPFGLP